MGVTAVGAVTNILLDAVFVAGLDWGVTGAAWATVIGQFLSAFFGAYLVWKGHTKVEIKRDTFAFDAWLSRTIIPAALPFGLPKWPWVSSASSITAN